MIRLVLFSLALSAGCMKTSATYCAKHGADDPENCPVDAPGGMTCTSSNDCAGNPETLVCNTGSGICVECNATSSQAVACQDNEPVCGDNDTCRECRTHDECASGACLPDGSCGTAGNVAYVDGTLGIVIGSECTQTAPCAMVSDALGVTPRRPYIKITGAVNENVAISNRDVTFIAAPGARIQKGSGTLLAVTGTSNVSVFDLQIGDIAPSTVVGVELGSGATGSVTLHRVRVVNNSRGAVIARGGDLSIQRSTISDNLGGGVAVHAGARNFNLRNNFILFNGRDSGSSETPYGGVLIEVNSISGAVEFNTIAYNESNGVQHRAGFSCFGVLNQASGNLVYGNHEGLMAPTESSQYGGTCQFGNTFKAAAGDLGFKSPNTAAFDPHLTVDSPPSIRDVAGDCTVITTNDIDGEPRAFGAGCDLGADEFVP